MKIATLLLASSVLTGCMIGDQGGGSGETDGDILFGAADPGDPAVGFVRNVSGIQATGAPGSFNGCSATLITPEIMLTAGHCASQGFLWTDVTFDPAPADLFAPTGTGGFIDAYVIADPAYNGDSQQGHDVALVFLGQPIYDVAPIPRGPLPAIGSAVKAVGYGDTNFDLTGFGTKRLGNLTVTAENQHEIAAGREGNNVCHGDSGGPILQNGVQVGVSSYVDTADCHGGGHFMRIDDSLDFIHTYVPFY
jgi:V8-like Glu-specific endopeptidase